MNKKLLKYLVITGLFCFSYNAPSYSQQIITDGNTTTNLSIHGKYTDVSTSTIKGKNAFNSFSRFNVETGNVVNLIVPGVSQNLINLVHSERSFIDGTLNSLKNNQIGGNIFFVNPYGLTVGSQGVINVGSLTAVTPTTDFMNRFFDSPGNPNDESVITLLNGTMPINLSADIRVKGAINALQNVKLDAGSIIAEGTINSGSTASSKAFETQDIINTNGYYDSESIEITTGEIVLKATENVKLAGTLNTKGADNINAGNVTILADNDITLKENSRILAHGAGENSSGGEVYIYAGNKSSFLNNAIINTRGGEISGNGGNIELSASNIVEINGGTFLANAVNGQAGKVLVDPATLNLSSTYSDGVDLVFEADDDINILDGAIISSRNLLNSATGEDVSGLDHINELSQGNSGNITFETKAFNMAQDSKILTFANNGYNSGDVSIITNNLDMNNTGISIDATGGNAIIYRKTAGVILISDNPKTVDELGIFTSEINKISADTLQIGESDQEEVSTENVFIISDLDYTGNLILDSTYYAGIANSSEVNITGNLTIHTSAPYDCDEEVTNITIGSNTITNVSGNLNLDGTIIQLNDNAEVNADSIDIISDWRVLFESGATLTANDDVRFQVNEIKIDTSTSNPQIISTNGNVIISSNAAGNIYLGEQGVLSPDEALKIVADTLYIGNHSDTNNYTNEIYINKDYNLVNDIDLILTANNNIFGSNRSLGTTGNIALIAKNGQIGYENQYVNVDEGNTKSLYASADGNIYLKESDGDMRIKQIQSNTGDIYLASENGGIINASDSNEANIIGNNLFFKEIQPGAEYFYIGVTANGSTKDKFDGTMAYFFSELQAAGENWENIPESNYIILDNSQRDVYKKDILGMIENYTNRMDGDDIFLFSYDGHGGDGPDKDPIDEVPGSNALNNKDEYISSNVRPKESYTYDYLIMDDEMALALKDADGIVVFTSAECQGGMFGGNADIDTVAEANGYKYFGMMEATEGYYGWGEMFTGSDGHDYDLTVIYQNFIRSINPEVDPSLETFDESGSPIVVQIPQAYNADGNVYLDEWFAAAKGGLDSYWVNEGGTVYMEKFQQFTNMSAEEIQANPIIVANWDYVTDTSKVSSVGNSTKALTIDITGNLDVDANGAVYLSGNVGGTSNILSTGSAINFSGKLAGSVTANAASNINLTQNTGNLSIDNVTSSSGTVNINNTSGHTYINKLSGANVFVNNTANTSNSNIVINPSGRVSASAGGNSLVLNTKNGSFVNNSGASALNAGAGRWLVYTDTPAKTNEGGLSYNKMYNKTYDLNAPSTIKTGNHMLYSITPTLTVTAVNKSKVYGFDNPQFTYTITGFLDGDTFEDALKGYPDLFSNATRNSQPGSYTITTDPGTLASLLGYQLNFVNGILNIIPATPFNSSIVRRFVNREVSSILNTSITNAEAAGDPISGYFSFSTGSGEATGSEVISGSGEPAGSENGDADDDDRKDERQGASTNSRQTTDSGTGEGSGEEGSGTGEPAGSGAGTSISGAGE